MHAINQFGNLSAGQIGPITQVSDGVYTSEAIAPTGERMYFAMEALGDDKNKWEIYKDAATLLVTGRDRFGTIGSLIELGSRINDEISLKEFMATRTEPNFWTYDKPRFEQLSAKLQERKIVVDSSKAKELSIIPHASNGINVTRQTHMVYASKSPIAGRANFPSSSLNFGAYVDRYSELIMSVGVTISDVVENRGIFRNPLSVVQGGYGGISMMVHSFTCMVAQDYCPSAKMFKVRPLNKMGEIFLNSLPKEQITVNGIRGDVYDGGFEHEQDVRIPVELLASLHRVRQ